MPGTIVSSKVGQVLQERPKRRKAMDSMTRAPHQSEPAILQLTEKSLNYLMTVIMLTPSESCDYQSWPERHKTIRYSTTNSSKGTCKELHFVNIV